MTPTAPTAVPGQPRPVVLLVNQISGHGHLDLYARLYSACVLDLGYDVVLIAEHDGGAAAHVRERCAGRANRFRFLSRRELRSTPEVAGDIARLPLAGRARRVWREEGATGVVRRVVFYGRRPFVRLLYATVGSAWARRLRELIDYQPNGMSFKALVEEIEVAKERLGVAPALVFFLYLDLMGDERAGRKYLNRRLRTPWAGILFHPRYDGAPDGPPPERYFETGSARGAAFLNPHFVTPYGGALPGLIFGAIPDVTDAALPDRRPELVERIVERAKGRTIVAFLGSLSLHKGFTQFRRVIDTADPQAYFFVMVGEVFWSTFGGGEAPLRAFASAPPENCFVHVGYVDDERDLNALIQASDILYAVYPNQRDSSNTLTKASLLERPVLVSDQHLMGERVAAYDIGATVPSDDVDRIVTALDRLRRRPRSEFGFAAYRSAHSLETLRKDFGALLRAWIA